MKARFAQKCSCCGTAIGVGDEISPIVIDGRHAWVHVSCDKPATAETASNISPHEPSAVPKEPTAPPKEPLKPKRQSVVNDPRQMLSDLVAQYGLGLCDDAKRLEALLKDVFRNEHKRETFVLVSALREGVVQDLRTPTAGLPVAALTEKLVRHLRDNLALDESAARWGVESWAVALGIQISSPPNTPVAQVPKASRELSVIIGSLLNSKIPVAQVHKVSSVSAGLLAPNPKSLLPPAPQPAPAPVMVPTPQPTVSSGGGIVLAAGSKGDPWVATLSPGGSVDLAAMVLQQRAKSEQERAKAEQEKQHAAAILQQARELADEANDYDAALELIESLDPKWRDEQFYNGIRAQRDAELESQAKQHAAELESQAKQHATQVQRQAKQYAEQSRDFAGAVRMIEAVEPRWRNAKLYAQICDYAEQVTRLDGWIHDAVQKGRLQFLRVSVQKLLKLQPKRDDMRRLLEVLPDEPELPKEFTNSFGMGFVLIEPGEFTMGSNRVENEKPPHLVQITQPFYLGVFPVTQREYKAVIGSNPSHFTGNLRLPVEQVSWNDAVAYCEKMSQLSSKVHRTENYRLPTEAEWEYACRAGSIGNWCFGDNESSLGEYAWVLENSGNRTHPVGEKKANAWGPHDMHGNVYEWCQDVYDTWAYGCRSGMTSDPLVTTGSRNRVVRGGSWSVSSSNIRSADRGGNSPGYRDGNVGFRVVLLASGVTTS